MVAEWYCEIEGQQHGPLTAVQLKQLATSGKLQPVHAIWKNGMQKKVPAKSVKGLFDAKSPKSAAPRAGAGTQVVEEIVDTDIVEVVETDLIEEIVEAVESVDAVEHVETVETIDTVEEIPDKPKKKKKDKLTPAEMIAEVSATYREGHPDLEGPISGTLYLEPSALRFDSDEAEFRLNFDKIENVREPAKGDFPEEMKSSAFKSKLAGTAGRLASGLVGSWLGGGAGKAAEKVGKEASHAAQQSGQLGKRPRNRIIVVVAIRGESCKVAFDINGESRDDMNDEAQVVYKKIQKARDKEATITQPEASGAAGRATSGANNIAPSAAHAAAPASGGAAKPFRILCAGQLLGPYSLDEVRKLLGKLGPGDMVGLECWLPAATLAGLMGSGKAAAGAGSGPGVVAGLVVGAAVGIGAAAALSSAGAHAHHEHVPEVDVKPEEEAAPAPHKDDGEAPIPVDADFSLD